jgi:hypothetical protein
MLAVDIKPALAAVGQSWVDIPKRQRCGISIDQFCRTAAPELSMPRIVRHRGTGGQGGSCMQLEHR